MTEIEKFLNEQFTQVITEDKMGIKCLYKHKEGVIDDGVVFFEFAKKKWSKKPIMNKRQFVICLLYTSPSPRDRQKSRMPSSA